MFKRKNEHVDGENIPIDFAKVLVAKVKPGIDFKLRSEYMARGAVPAHQPAEQGRSGEGLTPKRARRET